MRKSTAVFHAVFSAQTSVHYYCSHPPGQFIIITTVTLLLCRHFRFPSCWEHAIKTDTKNAELMAETMTQWSFDARDFLKELGLNLGMEINKSQGEYTDIYLPNAAPDVITFSTLDTELEDYMKTGTQMYAKGDKSCLK